MKAPVTTVISEQYYSCIIVMHSKNGSWKYTVEPLITHIPSERSSGLKFELMGMWVLRDTNNMPTNNNAKFQIGISNKLLRNVGFGGYRL